MDYNELIKALELIKNVCNTHKYCEECPFEKKQGVCLITEKRPTYWKIIEPKTIVKIME